MISAEEFLNCARDAGCDFFTGVPCSFLTPLINRVISTRELEYVAAASEGEAVAIAAGAWLAGRKTAVMCQNSGLGNAVNPLTSMNFPFRIPTLMVVTWRGQPGLKDEPQHALMGPITNSILETIRVPHRRFPSSSDDIAPTIAAAMAAMDTAGLPFALVMAKGDVADETLDAEPLNRPAPGLRRDFTGEAEIPSRMAALERLLSVVPEEAGIIATTGKCGRELFTLADRPQHLYQVGSMGCAAGMGLGVALSVKRSIVVLDGDGAALMKMGSMATIGAYAPDNLIHIVLDNGAYDSTGGQATVSPGVDFAGVAAACGYRGSYSCSDLGGLEQALGLTQKESGPNFIHMKIVPGSMKDLGRPTITPPEVARRFKDFLASR